MKNAILIALTLFVGATPALSSSALAKTDKPQLAKDDPNRVICRREATTGSIMGKKTCHTKAEWDQIAKQFADGKVKFDAVDARTNIRPSSD